VALKKFTKEAFSVTDFDAFVSEVLEREFFIDNYWSEST
jgi:hypothetical protein